MIRLELLPEEALLITLLVADATRTMPSARLAIAQTLMAKIVEGSQVHAAERVPLA